jgi:hypothetical protein
MWIRICRSALQKRAGTRVQSLGSGSIAGWGWGMRTSYTKGAPVAGSSASVGVQAGHVWAAWAAFSHGLGKSARCEWCSAHRSGRRLPPSAAWGCLPVTGCQQRLLCSAARLVCGSVRYGALSCWRPQETHGLQERQWVTHLADPGSRPFYNRMHGQPGLTCWALLRTGTCHRPSGSASGQRIKVRPVVGLMLSSSSSSLA